jgi:hypothetical protein
VVDVKDVLRVVDILDRGKASPLGVRVGTTHPAAPLSLRALTYAPAAKRSSLAAVCRAAPKRIASSAQSVHFTPATYSKRVFLWLNAVAEASVNRPSW